MPLSHYYSVIVIVRVLDSLTLISVLSTVLFILTFSLISRHYSYEKTQRSSKRERYRHRYVWQSPKKHKGPPPPPKKMNFIVMVCCTDFVVVVFGVVLFQCVTCCWRTLTRVLPTTRGGPRSTSPRATATRASVGRLVQRGKWVGSM